MRPARLLIPTALLLASTGATAVTITGVQPVATDLPKMNVLLRRGSASAPPIEDILELGMFSLRPAFIDTGASGVVFSGDTVDLLALDAEPGVTVTEVGIAGEEELGLTEPLFLSVGPITLDATDPATYTQTVGPVRGQIAGPQLPDIVGMPLIDGRVMVLDAKPRDLLFDTLRTFLYPPGTPFDRQARDTDPGIPPTALHVRLSLADFSFVVGVDPPDSPLPSLGANPMIGADPTLDPRPADAPPGVAISHRGVRPPGPHGDYLLDTGASSSFISIAEAAKVNVRYRAGTEGSAAPVLELIDTGVALPAQYTQDIGGVGGTLRVAGFFLDTLTLHTVEGEPIVFEGAPVGVLDIGTDEFVFDGVLGINFFVASAAFDGLNIGPFSNGAFEFVVYDDPASLLGVELASPLATTTTDLSAGLNLVALPLQPEPALTSHDLVSTLGDDVLRVRRLDRGTGRFQTTSRDASGPWARRKVTLVPGEAYLVEMSAPGSFDVGGFASAVAFDLPPGVSAVGFHVTPTGFGAHGLLTLVGDGTAAVSVSRFDARTGRFETASWDGNAFTGPDFAVAAGEGYFVSTPRPVEDLSVPRLIPNFVDFSFP